MNSVQKCEDLFNSLVSAIDAVYGSSMKTNIELIDIGAQIFPQLGHNVIRNADYDFEKMKGKYSIVNTDNGVGVHWFGVYQKGRVLHMFDTFDRSSMRLVPQFVKRATLAGFTIQDTHDKNHKREQRDEQEDCGIRSLAWLILVYHKGIRFASLI
jgi:hypothetical protein